MAATEISSYYAKFGFKIDTASVSAIKKQITQLQKFISKELSLNIRIAKIKVDKIQINKGDINRALREAVGKGTGGVTIPISSFSVNAIALRRAVQTAFTTGVTLRVNATTNSGSRASRVSGASNNSRSNSKGSLQNSFSRYNLGGAVGGLVAGYGVMGLNQRSEDLQSAKVSLNTITGGRGVDAFQWIKNQGNAQGFDYASQLPVFSNYLGASINKQGYDNSLTSFSNLSQYGLTHGADKQSMERAMLAIGQMWSKGKIMGEELNQQLAEAKGFSGAKSIIADAYQQSIGGKLTGQKAEAALIAAMKKGLVVTEKVMPFATQIMGEQAAGGRASYLATTGAQHARLTNSITNGIEVFGKGGFDEGMMRFFKFMADFLDKHSEDIRNLGKSFLDLELAFERITKGGAPLAAMLIPLWGIITTGVGKLGLLVAVLDDISVFVQGGDSVLGQVVTWFSELTNINFDAVAAGFSVVGAAILLAFSPMTAAVVAAGLIIEAYNKIQSIRNGADGVSSTQTSLPSWKDLDAQNAKNSNFGAFETLTGGYAGGGLNFEKFKGNNYLLSQGDGGNGYRPALLKARDALNSGAIGQEEFDRALTAAGGGYMTPDALASWINQTTTKRNNPNIFPAQQVPPIELYLNGTFNNEKVNVLDIIAQFSAKDSQPANQVGTAP